MNPVKIDLYTDIVCPWCLIGEYRLDKVIREHFQNAGLDIEHHPMLLAPDCPSEGIRIVDMFRERYGVTDPKQMWARPEAEARAVGLDLDLSKQPMFYPTLAGHTLIRRARAKGTQHRLSVALASAYFLDAKDIADPEVLAHVAQEYGFARDEALQLATSEQEIGITARAAYETAMKGIRAVPHFVVNGRTIDGHHEATLIAALQSALATEHA